MREERADRLEHAIFGFDRVGGASRPAHDGGDGAADIGVVWRSIVLGAAPSVPPLDRNRREIQFRCLVGRGHQRVEHRCHIVRHGIRHRDPGRRRHDAAIDCAIAAGAVLGRRRHAGHRRQGGLRHGDRLHDLLGGFDGLVFGQPEQCARSEPRHQYVHRRQPRVGIARSQTVVRHGTSALLGGGGEGGNRRVPHRLCPIRGQGEGQVDEGLIPPEQAGPLEIPQHGGPPHRPERTDRFRRRGRVGSQHVGQLRRLEVKPGVLPQLAPPGEQAIDDSPDRQPVQRQHGQQARHGQKADRPGIGAIGAAIGTEQVQQLPQPHRGPVGAGDVVEIRPLLLQPREDLAVALHRGGVEPLHTEQGPHARDEPLFLLGLLVAPGVRTGQQCFLQCRALTTGLEQRIQPEQHGLTLAGDHVARQGVAQPRLCRIRMAEIGDDGLAITPAQDAGGVVDGGRDRTLQQAQQAFANHRRLPGHELSPCRKAASSCRPLPLGRHVRWG